MKYKAGALRRSGFSQIFNMNCDPEKNDLTFAQRVASGDPSAQEELYLTFKNFVYCTCLKILKNPDTAEDISQITFIQILTKIKSFAGSSRLSTWIYKIAVNECLMHLRRERSLPQFESLSDLKDYRAPVYRDDIEDRLLLEDCIGKLPEGYKKYFVLHDVFGFEHSECAGIVGNSEGTSKSQLFKAREKMRKLIRKKNLVQSPAQI